LQHDLVLFLQHLFNMQHFVFHRFYVELCIVGSLAMGGGILDLTRDLTLPG
jgi:hypothetical protein